MRRSIRLLSSPALLTLLLTCVWAAPAYASTPAPAPTPATTINEVYMLDLPPLTSGGNPVAGRRLISVILSDDAATVTQPAAMLNRSNVRIIFVKSARLVPSTAINSITQGITNKWEITIDLAYVDEAKPDAEDDQVLVRFGQLTFTGGIKSGLQATGRIYNEDNKAELIAGLSKDIDEAAATSKTSEERNIFAGLSITVPSGGGDTEGSADININRNLYGVPIGQNILFDNVKFGLNLKKATEEAADPRHFTVGLTFRKTFLLLNREKLRNLTTNLLNLSSSGTPDITGNQDLIRDTARDLRELRGKFLRTIFLDNAIRFEGDVEGFSVGNVSNLLYDGQLQLGTATQGFAKGGGFFNLRLLGGVEAGYNITNQDNESQEKSSLARLKGGGVFTLGYNAVQGNEFLNRVEFETQFVNRYLFKDESAFDEEAKKAILVDKGRKYWLQSDLKFFFGPKLQSRRVGFRASFKRGQLPPVYAFTKSFNFGLVFETADDDTSDDVEVDK